MTCKKNEIRVIDDLELKDVAGGFMFLVAGVIVFSTILAVSMNSKKSKS